MKPVPTHRTSPNASEDSSISCGVLKTLEGTPATKVSKYELSDLTHLLIGIQNQVIFLNVCTDEFAVSRTSSRCQAKTWGIASPGAWRPAHPPRLCPSLAKMWRLEGVGPHVVWHRRGACLLSKCAPSCPCQTVPPLELTRWTAMMGVVGPAKLAPSGGLVKWHCR